MSRVSPRTPRPPSRTARISLALALAAAVGACSAAPTSPLRGAQRPHVDANAAPSPRDTTGSAPGDTTGTTAPSNYQNPMG